MMNDEQLLRYSRQIMLPQVDIRGQESLLQATALIIGLGGLGSPVAMYLAAAGVGRLILCDFDRVDLSNLQRQVIHDSSQLEQYKVDSAAVRLRALNPDVQIETITTPFDAHSLSPAVQAATVVIDCTDNLTTRLAINKLCVDFSKPLIYAAAIRMEGQLSVFHPATLGTPCYRCLYPRDDMIQETCTQSGVLAPIVGIIGSLQAIEAMKWIMGIGQVSLGRLHLLDALQMEWCEVKLQKNPTCPVCGHLP
ncbi:molybdopterin-synthase adenylyltransferase MoeB [Thioflexithrix psekupsensis]|uniref:Molybdopterin-synthase adenylyltransferase n=2 Tax=Thioflexithrix psekupsensis TaxID=1570016 RepID=A0A251X9S4_9GAMM|nr:molybdopterin-synthase adenylyltransferase MoeB [Thioflexithrix psekupsensis]